MTSSRLIVAASLAAALAAPVHALTLFSIDAISPSAVSVSPADILSPGPIGGPPVVAIPFGALGLLPGDDIDAISYSLPRDLPVHFSVDRLTVGIAGGALPPDVSTEVAAGQAAGDIDAGPLLAGGNTLVTNQDVPGPLPAIPPGPPAPPPVDDLDASLGVFSPASFLGIGPAAPSVLLAAFALGLPWGRRQREHHRRDPGVGVLGDAARRPRTGGLDRVRRRT